MDRDCVAIERLGQAFDLFAQDGLTGALVVRQGDQVLRMAPRCRAGVSGWTWQRPA